MIKHIIWLTILLSLFLHWSSYWGSSYISIEPGFISKQKKSIQVDIVEKSNSQQDQKMSTPIRFTEAPKELIDDSLESLKKKVELLSEKAQRVKKESQAKLMGMTKNRWQNSLQKNKTPSPSESEKNNWTKNLPKDIDGVSDSSPREKKSVETLDPGLSTFGNQLDKKVEVGNFTALNTDYHLFGSFYSRVEEMIRPPWEDKVTEEVMRIKDLKLLRPKGGWSTRMDVILNPKGELQKVVLLKSSGIKGFDEAARIAFLKAGFFPHPPAGMVHDGQIVLKYSFTVY